MMLPVFRAFAYPLIGLLAAGSSSLTTQQPTTAPNRIELLALNQPPCATLSPGTVVTAKLAYHIAPQEQSEHGFAVSIKFATPDPRRTFSPGRTGHLTVTQRHDTLTLQYPVAQIWGNPNLKRPITCYFYLHRNTGEGRSTVIARTPPIVFQECL